MREIIKRKEYKILKANLNLISYDVDYIKKVVLVADLAFAILIVSNIGILLLIIMMFIIK